jgi:hypothetical protein
MNPRDFLDVAYDLVIGGKEAEWRSAVSRAYYPVFHVAMRLLRQCGFTVPRADQAHQYPWQRLANSGHPDVRNASNDSFHLRKIRNHADYDLLRPVPQSTASGFVRVADTIIQLLELVENTLSVRTQITDAMRIYERDVLGEVTWHP